VADGLGATEADALADALAAALADPDATAEPEALPEADAPPLAEGTTEAGTKGLGVTSGNSLVGTPEKAITKISTNTTEATTTHGAASRSLRGGREPRYPSEDIAAVYRAPRMAGISRPPSPAAAISPPPRMSTAAAPRIPASQPAAPIEMAIAPNVSA
jgi:hypothetical protein